MNVDQSAGSDHPSEPGLVLGLKVFVLCLVLGLLLNVPLVKKRFTCCHYGGDNEKESVMLVADEVYIARRWS